jgi:Holliday junction resolvasome RuvABC endonuclease subunit
MIYIGCDVSVQSPGFAVFDTTTKIWSLYCFAQRKREIGLTFQSASTTITVWPDSLDCKNHNSDIDRYVIIINRLSEVVERHRCENEKVHMLIEDYAYCTSDSAHSTKLHEISGIIKYTFRNEYVKTIAIGTWKKAATGNGRASKQDAVDTILQRGPKVDVHEVFGMPKKIDKTPATPIQDLADAACIVLAVVSPVPTKKKRKRKKNVSVQKNKKIKT